MKKLGLKDEIPSGTWRGSKVEDAAKEDPLWLVSARERYNWIFEDEVYELLDKHLPQMHYDADDYFGTWG